MEPYLMITQLNDFIFCPRSIFFSSIYRNTTTTEIYHQTPQTVGLAHHRTLDDSTYSSRKNVLTGLTVYSSRYNLLGCIDIFDSNSGLLTERKYSITAVYDGFRYQLFAQFFALSEMGYHVKAMKLHSLKDNKNYAIDLPTHESTASFENLLDRIRHFSLFEPFSQNPKKCLKCIYAPLCDYGCQLQDSISS